MRKKTSNLFFFLFFLLFTYLMHYYAKLFYILRIENINKNMNMYFL